MRYLKYILLQCFVLTLMAFACHKNPLLDPNTPTVKLSATINDSSETIHLGDTLTFTLTVPDTVSYIYNITGTVNRFKVNSLQTCMYNFHFYYIDTITKTGERIFDSKYMMVKPPGSLGGLASVYTNTASTNVSILKIVPPKKGLFYISFDGQETSFKANKVDAGLRVNINVTNKHWVLYANIYGNYTISGFEQNDFNGYAFYCFRVN